MIMARLCYLSPQVAEHNLLYKLMRPLLYVLKKGNHPLNYTEDVNGEILDRFAISTNLESGEQIFEF